MTTAAIYQNGGWIKYPDRVTTRTFFRSDDRYTQKVTVKQGNVLKAHSFVESIRGGADAGKVRAHSGLSEAAIVKFSALTVGQTIILGGLTFTSGASGTTAAQVALAWSNIADGTTAANATTAAAAAGVTAAMGTFTAGTMTGWNTFPYDTIDCAVFRATTYATNVTDLGLVSSATITATGGQPGQAVITTASTTGAANGAAISGPGIPDGTTIVSFVANTSITLSNNLTTAASTTAAAYSINTASTGTGTSTISKVDGASFYLPKGVTMYDVDATAGDVETTIFIEASFWAEALVWAVNPLEDYILDSLGNQVLCSAYNTGVYGPDATVTRRLQKQFVELSEFQNIGFLAETPTIAGTTYYV